MRQKRLSEKAVLKTLIYSDIFDYPLTAEQIKTYLLGNVLLPKDITGLSAHIKTHKSYFFLKRRKALVKKREEREMHSNKKLQKAQKIIRLLGFIPTICTIGISGSLAMKNATKSDDIDLFIITRKNSIWITRLLVLSVLVVLGKKRNRNAKKTSNRFCTNMFITEDALVITKQNLFSAHEVIQVLPIFDTDNTYANFLQANSWVKQFLPHVSFLQFASKNSSIIRKIIALILVIAEIPAKIVQVIYMQRHKTSETTKDTLLAFHPNDATQRVLRSYAQKLKKYGISI